MASTKLIALILLEVLAAFVNSHPNPMCTFRKHGVSEDDIRVILEVHNKFRSEVATGQFSGNKGLASASNMRELEWDTELGQIAQEWTDQCNFKRECPECHRVERFHIGHHEHIQKTTCSNEGCALPEWESRLKEQLYGKQYKEGVSSYVIPKENAKIKMMMWAESYKIGCGYAAYKGTEFATEKLYMCTYGPMNNNSKGKMYEEGEPCSKCPSNTTCGVTYPGLCSNTSMTKA